MTIRRSLLPPCLAAVMAVSLCGCLQTLDQIAEVADAIAGPNYNSGSYYNPQGRYSQGGGVIVTSGYGLPTTSNNVYNMTGREFLQGGYQSSGYSNGYGNGYERPACPPPGNPWGRPVPPGCYRGGGYGNGWR